MLKISRKTEYAALAVEYMAAKGGQGVIASVREISDHFDIPYHLLAKTLQKLASHGVLKAQHGTKGGYMLARSPADLNLADLVTIFEGSLAVTNCFRTEKIDCPQWSDCTIKNPLSKINFKIMEMLRQTTMADLVAGSV